MAEKSLAEEIGDVISRGVSADLAAQIVASDRARRAGIIV